MHHTASELWRRAGEGTNRFFARIPGADLRQAPEGFLMITGEPVPDLNGALIDEGPNDARLLREYVGAIRDRGLDGFVWLTSAAQAQLAAPALELGLTVAGPTSLMSYQVASYHESGQRYRVEVVRDRQAMDAFNSLMARGFELPLDTWRRLVTLESLEDPAITHLVAFLEEEPVSGGTTITTGSTVGIWNMATPAEHQRKGAGRAVLDEALRLNLLQGHNIFYLVATDAGKHLYEQVGFRTVDEATLWLIGA